MKKIENINDLIALMEDVEEQGRIDGIGFDMQYPYPITTCGSACCIGGWVKLANKTPHRNIIETFIDVTDVSTETAFEVCYPCNSRVYNEATAADAVKVLTTLRDTGKVIWDEIFNYNGSIA